MKCERCGSHMTVYGGLDYIPGGVIRYRVCQACGHRIRSVEQIICAVSAYRKQQHPVKPA